MSAAPAPADLLALLAAIVLAAAGGEAFLKGVLGVAAHLRLPQLLVATTLAAFATSSPELTVSVLAALEGRPEIGLGNALGANVVNIALILGIVLLFGRLPAHWRDIRRDFALALGAPALTLALALDGGLSRVDGGVLLGLFAFWLWLVSRQARHHRRRAGAGVEGAAPAHGWPRIAAYSLFGLACLTLAGHLFVAGATGIALAFGVHPFIIGATIVAIGTTLPELMTSLLARFRGHHEVGLGTLLGSNLFNGLAIAGTAAAIHPIRAPLAEVAVALGFGLLTVFLMLPRAGQISRPRGFLLLAAYAAFVLVTLYV